MSKYDNKERIKYERMWDLDSYRERSPGERFFTRAVNELIPEKGRDSLCDWGIGTGRAATLFANYGLKVEGVDIAHNAAREFHGTVHIGPIWNPPLPADKLYTFGYCTDVMEHLPPDMVLESLKAIKRHTVLECWFSIANFHDREGDRIGETLHLSVRPADWWAASFARVFPKFHFSSEAKHFIVRAFCENHRA